MTRVATVAFALMTAIALPAFAQGVAVTPLAPVAAAKPGIDAATPVKPAATTAAVPAGKAAPVAAKPADPTKKPIAAAGTAAPVTKTP